MESLVGRTLYNGKYLIEKELGHGGFGITYKAINQMDKNKPVVIKTLKKVSVNNAQRKKLKEEFEEEVGRLVKCEHTNIVRYGKPYFFEENDRPFIVMEYIPGPTLDQVVLPDNPLPEATAIEYIKQIAEALKVVHKKGFLHRDVKPQNLILHAETGKVILIDFGISRRFSQGKTQTHTNLISEGYAPLEQYLPKAKRTTATDVYGLAATLYTLVTGRIPIAPTLRDRIPLDHPRDLQPHLSQGISDAIMAGMEIEARDRPATVNKWLKLLSNPSRTRNLALAGGTPGRSDRRPTRTQDRSNLSLTAKEEDLDSFSSPNRLPNITKSLLFASLFGFGIAYALEMKLLSFGKPPIQETIEPDSSLKNLNSQKSQKKLEAERTTRTFEKEALQDRQKTQARKEAEENAAARQAASIAVETEQILDKNQETAKATAEYQKNSQWEQEKTDRVEKQQKILQQKLPQTIYPGRTTRQKVNMTRTEGGYRSTRGEDGEEED